MARPESTDPRRLGGAAPTNGHGGSRSGSAAGLAGAPVPEDNQPGHHPDHEQDKPDPDEFVERFRHAPAAAAEEDSASGEPDGRAVWPVAAAAGAALAAGVVAIVVLRRRRQRHWWNLVG